MCASTLLSCSTSRTSIVAVINAMLSLRASHRGIQQVDAFFFKDRRDLVGSPAGDHKPGCGSWPGKCASTGRPRNQDNSVRVEAGNIGAIAPVDRHPATTRDEAQDFIRRHRVASNEPDRKACCRCPAPRRHRSQSPASAGSCGLTRSASLSGSSTLPSSNTFLATSTVVGTHHSRGLPENRPLRCSQRASRLPGGSIPHRAGSARSQHLATGGDIQFTILLAEPLSDLVLRTTRS